MTPGGFPRGDEDCDGRGGGGSARFHFSPSAPRNRARSRFFARSSFRFAASACSQKPRVRKESDVSASDAVDWITRSPICVALGRRSALHERGGTGRRLVRARDHDVGRRRSPGEARVVQPPGHGARQVRGRGSGLVRAPASALQGTVASEDGSHGSPCRFPESLDPPPADRPRPPPPCSPAASPAWRIPLIWRPRTMARAPGPAARTPRNAKRCGASSKI